MVGPLQICITQCGLATSAVRVYIPVSFGVLVVCSLLVGVVVLEEGAQLFGDAHRLRLLLCGVALVFGGVFAVASRQRDEDGKSCQEKSELDDEGLGPWQSAVGAVRTCILVSFCGLVVCVLFVLIAGFVAGRES